METILLLVGLVFVVLMSYRMTKELDIFLEECKTQKRKKLAKPKDSKEE